MSTTLVDPGAHRDRSHECEEQFKRRRAREVAALLDDALVAEHAANPLGCGGRSLPLQHVHNFLTAQPIEAVYCTSPRPGSRWAIVRTPRGGPPLVVGDADGYEAARHAIFLRQVAELRAFAEASDA